MPSSTLTMPEPGGVVMERHADSFVIENPGTLLVSMEQYQPGGVSECRNKALQQMFLMIGGGEQAGSGADKIRSGWRSQHWRAPQIEHAGRAGPSAADPAHGQPDSRGDAVIGSGTSSGLALDSSLRRSSRRWRLPTSRGRCRNARLQELLDRSSGGYQPDARSASAKQGYLLSDNRRRWTTYRLSGTTARKRLTPAVARGLLTFAGGLPTFDPGTPHTWPADSVHIGGDPALSPRS